MSLNEQSRSSLNHIRDANPVIGVLSKPSERLVVEEFFELFKTPWEHYDPSRSYDVIIVSSDVVPDVNAKLLLVYGAQAKSTDTRNGITVRSQDRGGWLDYQRTRVPIYGDLATFRTGNRSQSMRRGDVRNCGVSRCKCERPNDSPGV